MKPLALCFSLAVAIAAAVVSPEKSSAQSAKKAPAPKFAEVQEILNERCTGCHGENGKAGIDLRTHKSIMEGGEEGPIVKKGAPGHSVLVKAMRGAKGVRRMPPLGTRMDDDSIKVIEAWILAGAKPK